MKIWIVIVSLLLISGISSTKSRDLLKRQKRWDNNGDMNNNGDMSNMFRGTAGVDYPNYNSIPTTSFRCDDQIYEGGLYADVEAQCQVYHVCHDGRKDSFLCGRGTIFNQEILACDYWYSTECDKAPSFYYVNEQIGKSGSSWVPPPEGHQGGNPGNFQDANYRPIYNNDGSRGGNSYQPTEFGSNNDGQGGGFGSDNNGQDSGFGSNNNGQGGGFGSNNNGQGGGFGSNNNGQGGGFGSNNNGQGGGFGSNNNGQGGGFGSNNNRQDGGFGSKNNGQSGNKEDCCCQKYSYKTPWEFPAS